MRKMYVALRTCNAAFGKPAYQISDLFQHGRPYPALLATDGSHIASLEVGSCALTGPVVDPWWCVDLGSRMAVKLVALTTRQ